MRSPIILVVLFALYACEQERPSISIHHLPVVQQYEFICVDGVETIYYTNEAGQRFGPELTGERCDPTFQRRPRKADM